MRNHFTLGAIFLFEAQGGIEKSMFTACPCNFIFFASKQGQMARIEKLHFFPLLTFLKENFVCFRKEKKSVLCGLLRVTSWYQFRIIG